MSTDHDNITVSRIRYEMCIYLAFTGWLISFLLLGILLGESK
jgi:hypothetical protein